MKKAKYVIVALVVTLALIGAAYAAWTQTITITGTASTGSLYVGITGNSVTVSNNNEQTGTTAQFTNGTATAATNGGVNGDNLTVNLSSSGAGNNNFDDQMTITMTNLYPGYKAVIDCTVKNDGTVPLTLGNWALSNGALPNGVTAAWTPKDPGFNGNLAAGASEEGTLTFTMDPNADNSTMVQNATFTYTIPVSQNTQ